MFRDRQSAEIYSLIGKRSLKEVNLRVLVIHNTYQHRGGEDSVVEAEIALLRAHDHEVVTYFRNNDDILNIPVVVAARQTLWSSRTTQDLTALIHSFRPDIIHSHNTFPLISPSVYWAAERASVPVVQTLHNFRLMCLSALFLRDGKVCEDCQGSLPWRGVIRKCYRRSGAASTVLAGMLMLHRGIGTYRNMVARYIALNDFCRNKFIKGGIAPERIVVKPNFIDFPFIEARARCGLLFVGRLSVEKGVASLAGAATLLHDAQLRIVGDGPESFLLDGINGVVRLGSRSGEFVLQEMSHAAALVVPSIWYENFPRTIVEAFASALPVIASRIGALADLIQDGETGLLFEPGNPRDLAEKMTWALENPKAMSDMGHNARLQYEAKYSAEVNYGQLIGIYKGVLAERISPIL